ncbi:MAG: family 1 encapsulin nanocompartment shell protein [Bacteroidales bacterium]
MNILKKNIAPITDQAWKEINEVAGNIFEIYLSGRRLLDIDGPNGLEMGAISTGHLIMPDNPKKEGINWGIREVMPLIEIRKPFELDIMEIDNINRGALDADIGPLEEAAKEIALFEEKVIYEGFSRANIKGLEKSASDKATVLPDDPGEFLTVINEQLRKLMKEGVEGPYSLILSEDKMKVLNSISKGYPVEKQLKKMISGKIITQFANNKSYLLSERGGDYEMVLGQDMSIGYDAHDTRKVKLYFTESFTFRVMSPEAIKVFTGA